MKRLERRKAVRGPTLYPDSLPLVSLTITPSFLLQETHHFRAQVVIAAPALWNLCFSQALPTSLAPLAGSFQPRPPEARSPILAAAAYFWPLPAIRKPTHFPSAHPLRAPPPGHTLNSAIVRLRLYRFSERKLLRELLMKTVTVGADTPVTSISRSAGRAGSLQPRQPPLASSAAAAPGLPTSPRPGPANPRAPPAARLRSPGNAPVSLGRSGQSRAPGWAGPPIAAREAAGGEGEAARRTGRRPPPAGG